MARIAFVLPNMGGGGAERVSISLIAGFIDQGHEVDLVLMQATGELLPLVPASVRIFDLKAGRLRHSLLPLMKYLRSERPDAMQVSMWPLTIIGIVAARWVSRGTSVVTSDHSTLSCRYNRFPSKYLLQWTVGKIYPWANANIAVSEGVAADLRMIARNSSLNIRAIPNPVPVPPPDPDADQNVDAVWGRRAHRVLAVGKFKTVKNFALLLDALARVDPAFDWRLVLLGDGPLRRSLTEKVVDLGLIDRIVMPGFISDPAPYFRTATHYVLSSDFEGLPTVLIEALHAGLTVVATDCPSGPREILADDGGTLVPVGNVAKLALAIQNSFACPADRHAQRRRGAKWRGVSAAEEYCRAMGLDPK